MGHHELVPPPALLRQGRLARHLGWRGRRRDQPAAHQIDLWQWLCGTPRTVYAKVPFGFAHAIDVEDDVTAVLNYGREGTGVFITDATIESIIRGTVDWGDFSATEVVEGTSSYGVNHAQVLENFARAILFGEPLIAPVADGLDAVRLSNAPPLG